MYNIFLSTRSHLLVSYVLHVSTFVKKLKKVKKGKRMKRREAT